jgi:hypothetical protein
MGTGVGSPVCVLIKNRCPSRPGDVVGGERIHPGRHIGLEQRLGNRKRRTWTNGDSRQLPVFGEVVDLAPVGPPVDRDQFVIRILDRRGCLHAILKQTALCQQFADRARQNLVGDLVERRLLSLYRQFVPGMGSLFRTWARFHPSSPHIVAPKSAHPNPKY